MRIMHAAIVGVLGRARVRLPICMCSGLTTHSCRCCSSSIARLRGWLVGLRHQFEVTTFDFIDLMEIDWRSAFTCPNGAKQLTGDGIAIGFKASECFIQRPWEADPDGALVAGTLLQHRVFVAQPAQRQALLKLADPKVGGLPREPLAALKRRIGRMAATAFERAAAMQDGLQTHSLTCRVLAESLDRHSTLFKPLTFSMAVRRARTSPSSAAALRAGRRYRQNWAEL